MSESSTNYILSVSNNVEEYANRVENLFVTQPLIKFDNPQKCTNENCYVLSTKRTRLTTFIGL